MVYEMLLKTDVYMSYFSDDLCILSGTGTAAVVTSLVDTKLKGTFADCVFSFIQL